MSKLIDADILIKEIKNTFDGYMIEDNQLTPLDVVWKLEEQPTIHAIPLDKVKAAREEISDYNIKEHYFGSDSFLIGIANGMDKAVEILDKLIAESEVGNGNDD